MTVASPRVQTLVLMSVVLGQQSTRGGGQMGDWCSKEVDGAYLPPYPAVNDWVLVSKVSVLGLGDVWLN